MAHFNKPTPGLSTPIGKNQYLRSTEGCKYESYTTAAGAVTAEDFKNAVGVIEKIKYLQAGEVMAKITSGPNAGLIGPFQAGATDGRQTAANIVGVNDSYIPAQLNERNVDTSCLYIGTIKQAWCFERDANGLRIPLTDATVNAMRGTKGLDITAK